MLRDLRCIEKAEFSSSLQCEETTSLGPGSAMGEKKIKNGVKREKNRSASKATAGAWRDLFFQN